MFKIEMFKLKFSGQLYKIKIILAIIFLSNFISNARRLKFNSLCIGMMTKCEDFVKNKRVDSGRNKKTPVGWDRGLRKFGLKFNYVSGL